ncbi:MAG TPA: RHS repeat-associated core domain-containing protein, partial [Gaiellaceae bacterium]|nr:RHS repeat-associated core domain-containing protein [Gaiellaceae bacterium]
FAVDRAGLASATVKVTIDVIPPGPLAVDDTYTTTRDNPLTVLPAAGVLANDRDAHSTGILTASLNRGAIHGTVDVDPDGSFVYTPDPGYVGDDSFLYVTTDLPGLTSTPAHVAITVAAPAGPVPTIGDAAPADGTRVTAPTPITATIAPPAGQTIASWKVTTRNCDRGTPNVLASGTGVPPSPIATFDPTTLVNGCYQIQVAATASGGGESTSVSSVIVAGDMKLGEYQTTYRDIEVSVGGLPVQVLRTYDSFDKQRRDFGVGWKLELSGVTVTPNGRLGQGGWSTEPFGFPFTRYRFISSKPHFVTITSADGRVEVFDFVPAPAGPLLSLTTPEYVPRPGTGTTGTLEDVEAPTLSLSGSTLATFLSGDIYDPHLFRYTTADGHVLIIDRFNGLQSVTDRNGNRLTVANDGVYSSPNTADLAFTRDGAGRITEIRSLDGRHATYAYSAAGDLQSVTGVNGSTQTYTYDDAHDLLTSSAGGQAIRTLHYDDDGRLLAVTDGDGNTSKISTDLTGRRQTVTDETGRLTTVYSYDTSGNLVQQDRASGGVTITEKSTYDAMGRQLSSTDGLGHTTSQAYDASGNVITQTDANGKTTTFTYNAFGEPLTATDPLGHTTTNKYDAVGNLTETDAADGGVTAYSYDSAGHVLTSTDPTGRVTKYTYDSHGQLSSTTDPGGHTSHQTTDPTSGRVLTLTDANDSTTKYEYNADGYATSITNPNGHAWSATYDSLDRVTSLTDPTGATVHKTYDAAGNLASTTNRDGQTITYTYDADSRLVSTTVPGAGTTTYTYDGFGRLVAAANATAQLAMTYDAADRKLSEMTTPSTPGGLPTSTFKYTYDSVGNETSVQGPEGTTAYGYNAGSQLTSLTDPAGGTFDIGYDDVGRQMSLARPSGVDDSTVYDAAGRVTSLRSTRSSTLMNQADYTYDPAGRRSSLTTTAGRTTFTYDSASQLTSVVQPPGSGVEDERYTYDAAGNRTSTANSPLGSFAYDGGERMVEDATATYQYDKEGNLTTRVVKANGATTHYSWAADHQLLSITRPDGSTSTYRYDPAGRRVEISDGASTSRFAFDQQAVAAEYDGTNAVVATYVNDPTTPTRTFEMTRGGQRYLYLTDAQGSTTALTTIGGVTANTYAYGAFGQTVQTGTVPNPFTYTGQLFDPTAGLFLFPLRAYDPTLGRFLSEDPVGSTNRYVYVNNNPITYIDPTGAAALIEYHHIIAQNAKRAALARFILTVICNIGINSAINLIALPYAEHSGLHTGVYYSFIDLYINQAFVKGGCQAVALALGDLGGGVP